MKSERWKIKTLLSFVRFHYYHLYFAHFKSVPVAQVCCANIKPTLKTLVTMDLSSSSMISFLIYSSINIGHPPCFSITFRICVLSIVFSASSRALFCVKIVFHWSYCKSVDFILLHPLHHFHSLLKGFYRARYILSCLERVVSFHSHPSSFKITYCCTESPLHWASHYSLLPCLVPHCAEFSHRNLLSHRVFPTTPKFSIPVPYRVKYPLSFFYRVKFSSLH